MSRPSSDSTTFTGTRVYTSGNPVQNTLINQTGGPWYEYVRTYTGSKNPQWPKVKNDLPYSMRYHRASYPAQTTRRTNSNFGPNWWDQGQDSTVLMAGLVIPDGCPYQYSDVTHDAALYKGALNAAIDAVKDQKFNFAQFVAERKQVVRSITDTTIRLAKAITALKRGRYSDCASALGVSKSPKKMSGNVSKDWLAYQYGWKPLLSDCQKSAEHLAQNHLGRPVRIKIRKSRGSDTKAPDGTLTMVKSRFVGTSKVYAGTDPWQLQTWTFREPVEKTTVYLEYEVSNDYIRQGSQLGITDPALLAWELLPYSFVVDWFLPIGDFLKRITYDDGLTFKRGWTSQFTLQEVDMVSQGWELGPWKTTVTGGSSKMKNYRHDRQVLYSSPAVDLPSFKDPFSPTHALNALALMRVAFR